MTEYHILIIITDFQVFVPYDLFSIWLIHWQIKWIQFLKLRQRVDFESGFLIRLILNYHENLLLVSSNLELCRLAEKVDENICFEICELIPCFHLHCISILLNRFKSILRFIAILIIPCYSGGLSLDFLRQSIVTSFNQKRLSDRFRFWHSVDWTFYIYLHLY